MGVLFSVVLTGIAGGTLAAVYGCCYPPWGEAIAWHRIDNAFFGATMAMFVVGIPVAHIANGLVGEKLVHGLPGVFGGVAILTAAAWGPLVELPLAIALNSPLPPAVVTISRDGLALAVAAWVTCWSVRAIRSDESCVDVVDEETTAPPNSN